MSYFSKINESGVMSSFAISAFTNRSIGNVHRDVRKIISQLEPRFLTSLKYEEIKDHRGYTKEMLLSRDLAMLLLTGYDVNTRLEAIRLFNSI